MNKNIADIRKDYRLHALNESDAADDAIEQFTRWWNEAVNSEIVEVNAMTLATATKDGKPSARIVLLKDFDKNGSVEQIMAYTIDGKEYPFLTKDELERSLPVLKKAYLAYSEVAGKTVDYIFYDLFKDYKELEAETLGSAVFVNDGKGSFNRIDLSPELQLSPIFAFQQLPDSNRFIAGGNFFGVIPYEGQYDAAALSIFNWGKTNEKYAGQGNKVLDIKGEVRDLKWLQSAKHGKLLVVERNNDSLRFYSLNKL